MQPIHLAIGLVEGLITAAVLLFVYESRPELLQGVEKVLQPGLGPLHRVELGDVVHRDVHRVVPVGGVALLLDRLRAEGQEHDPNDAQLLAALI